MLVYLNDYINIFVKMSIIDYCSRREIILLIQ
jgi:hypothetical protein